MTYTKEQIVTKLKELENNWPRDLMLFSWSGTLCLLTRNEHESIMRGDAGFRSIYCSIFPGIPNDGGCP